MKVAVVGATGAVGKELVRLLDQRKFPVSELVPFASPRSKGKLLAWKGKEIPCRVLEAGCFQGVNVAFFDASDAVSAEWVPQAAAAGAWVVDNAATFRMDDDVLLVVPEVNGKLLTQSLNEKSPLIQRRIVTGPNCVAVPMAVALKPIQERWGIKRLVVSTYQSTSGAGALAMDELRAQAKELLSGKALSPPQVFPHQIAFNCIPHIGRFQEDFYTGEEHKIVAECQKLLGEPQLKISATAVRVPSFSCHGMSINVECKSSIKDLSEVREVLKSSPGILFEDDVAQKIYPLGVVAAGDSVQAATGSDWVHVGRVRRDPTVESGLNLWVVSDNLRKGAALNAVQVAEVLLKSLS